MTRRRISDSTSAASNRRISICVRVAVGVAGVGLAVDAGVAVDVGTPVGVGLAGAGVAVAVPASVGVPAGGPGRQPGGRPLLDGPRDGEPDPRTHEKHDGDGRGEHSTLNSEHTRWFPPAHLNTRLQLSGLNRRRGRDRENADQNEGRNEH
ncbi:hypothetical protein BRC67_02890 [Halobacteriales archaeon QH_3_68_24]|nr:MAG: hypothetical protein BRC67_02890 [Halobacteriales archaeon QH_3_68_24]